MLDDKKSLDLLGIGELAKAIPDSVYEQTSKTITSSFEKLIAPITETTSGLGRYIRQKFDNMVNVEKSLFIYSLQNAQNKIEQKGLKINTVSNPKSIIRILEEVSQETDPLLNVLWTNLLCSQLIDKKTHPYFIHILSSLSADEAVLLESLNSFNNIGRIAKNVLIMPHSIDSWVRSNGAETNDWDFSCNLLCEFGLTKTTTPFNHKRGEKSIVLYRTFVGDKFLSAVKT